MTIAQAALQIALVGNPNSGKSTLFNTLTGAHAKVINAPGTTVDLQTGRWSAAQLTGHAREVDVVDLPGTYSLQARSPDEQVTADYLRQHEDVAVVVLDATALARSLYLLSQVLAAGIPVVAAVTMLDVAATRGVDPDLLALADATGVQVVAVDPRTGSGVAALAAAISRTLELDEVSAGAHVGELGVGLGADARTRELGLGADARTRELGLGADAPYGATGLTLGSNPQRRFLRASGTTTSASSADTVAASSADTVAASSADTVAASSADTVAASDFGATASAAHFAWTERVLSATLPSTPQVPVRSVSDRLDRVLLHPIFGLPVFALVMWVMFELTTTVATPLVDGMQSLFTGPLADLVRAFVPGGWLQSLLVNGVLTGVGTVLSFTPLLAIVFLGIALLEDSGYLARAAYVADRALRTIGLDGRAMVPLVIGFGCNVPAIAATATMPDSRRRLLTGLLIPLTSCPARLTVYVLVAGAFFPGHVGTVIFLMYGISALLVVLGGLLLRATAFRDLRRTQPLVLALPAYHLPRLKTLVQDIGLRVLAYIKGAGGLIAGVMVLVWLLSAIPMPVASGGEAARFGEVYVGDSVFGRASAAVAPVLAPAGLDDWRIASSLAAGFVAKEATVGALTQSLAGDDSERVVETGDVFETGDAGTQDDVTGGLTTWLAQAFHRTLNQSSNGHATAAAGSFLVLVLANTPCLATVAEQRRVFGWRYALGSVVAQMALAWLLATITFQVLRVFWVAN